MQKNSIYSRWAADSKEPNGGIGFTPQKIPDKSKVKYIGFSDSEMKRLFGRKNEKAKMKVSVYVINKGHSGQYYGLKNSEDNQVLHYAPNNWKTEKGALRWAKNNGYEVEAQ